MKHLKPFQLFESLSDDFSVKISELDEFFGTDDEKLGQQVKQFSDLLGDKLKNEFVYRVTGDEDVIDLIEEFIDKVKLDDENDFKFRVLVMGNRIEILKETKGIGVDLIVNTETYGSDNTISWLKKNLKDGFDSGSIIELVRDGIEYLKKTQELFNWTYQREQNVNEKKIKAGEELIERLGELSDLV